MSKSGSRYGRRSNWFKIHCLLQEQQTNSGNSQQNPNASNLEQLARLHQIHARQTYQDKTNPCIKSAISQLPATLAAPGSNVMTPNSFTNFLNPAKYFNGHDNNSAHKTHESRLSDTPSDSGASSAGDPTDDCTSNNSIRQNLSLNHHQQHQHNLMAIKTLERNCSSVHQSLLESNGDEDSDERERRRQQFLQIFRSHSEPLSPFANFHFAQLQPPQPVVMAAGTPPSFLVPTVIKNTNQCVVKQEIIQEEPIDLSVKSRHSQTPESRPKSLSPEPQETNNEEPVNVLTKTTPLDLTLMRTTQTLTG